MGINCLYFAFIFSVHEAKGHRLETGEAILPPMTQEERDSIPWR
jgi:hypothetical protein